MIDIQYTTRISLCFGLEMLKFIWTHLAVMYAVVSYGYTGGCLLAHEKPWYSATSRESPPTDALHPPIDFGSSNLLLCRYLRRAEEFKEKPLLSGSRTIVFTRFFVQSHVLFVRARMWFQLCGSVVFRSKSFTLYLSSQAGLSLTLLWHRLSFIHFLHCPPEPLALSQH